MGSPSSFSKKNYPISVARFECVGFSMYACGFSVPKMRQFCFTYPLRSKWASSENIISFFGKPIAGPLPSVVQAYTQPYSYSGRIKLIICQIRHELSVTIHEISNSWKNRLMADPILFRRRLAQEPTVCVGSTVESTGKVFAAFEEADFYWVSHS